METEDTQVLHDLKCPYCDGQMDNVEQWHLKKELGVWGVIACDCDEYPIVEGIVWLLKDDAQNNRVIVNRLRAKQWKKALSTALSSSGKFYRLWFMMVWQLRRMSGITLPLAWFYSVLSFIGGRKNWYRYLSKRHQWPDLEIGIKVIRKREIVKPGMRIVDLGCGMGHSTMRMRQIYSGLKLGFVGIDKHFDSLLANRLYLAQRQNLLVLCEIEHGLPLIRKSWDGIIMFDVFNWIYQKERLVKDIWISLKSRGFLYISNIGGINTGWGYGIKRKQLKKLMGELWELEIIQQNKKEAIGLLGVKRNRL